MNVFSSALVNSGRVFISMLFYRVPVRVSWYARLLTTLNRLNRGHGNDIQITSTRHSAVQKTINNANRGQ